MSQILYLPMDDVTVNVGYKSKKYKEEWSCEQYGTDIAGQARMVNASAIGTIEKIGTDNTDDTVYCVIRYDDIKCLDGKTRTIWVKYGHLIRCQLDEGYQLEDGELIGSYEGGYLHIEMTDKQPDYEKTPVFNSVKRTYDDSVPPYMVWKIRQEDNPDMGVYKQTLITKDEWLKAGWVDEYDILDFSSGTPEWPDDEKTEPENPDTEIPDDENDNEDTDNKPDDKPENPEDGGSSIPNDWETRYKCLMYDLFVLVKKYML